MNKTIQRAKALKKARDKAKDPEFKKLWNIKLKQLIKEQD